MTATITTEKGEMKVEFFEKDAPNTVKNFLDLSKKGYYDGLNFHRVIPNFRGSRRMPRWNGCRWTGILHQLRIGWR